VCVGGGGGFRSGDGPVDGNQPAGGRRETWEGKESKSSQEDAGKSPATPPTSSVKAARGGGEEEAPEFSSEEAHNKR